MFLFVGLGNPGKKYEKNRHNLGFMVVDAIAKMHDFSSWCKKFHAEVSQGSLQGSPVLLFKPQTFMNLSGQAVGDIVRYYNLDTSQLTVFHDDIDLSEGKLRLKTGGSHGGHNGLLSLNQHIRNGYKRVRIGIGHPGIKELVNNHVLGNFTKEEEEKWLIMRIKAIAQNAALLISGKEADFVDSILKETKLN